MNSLTYLLEKNMRGDLSEEEYKYAERLIENNLLTDKPCWQCEMSTPNSIDMTMMDFPLCKGHAIYVLATGR